MIYYKLEEGLHEFSEIEDYDGDTVILLNHDEFMDKVNDNEIDESIIPKYKNARCCKLNVYNNCISGYVSILSKNKKIERTNFGIIIEEHRVIFIDNGSYVRGLLKKLNLTKFHFAFTVGRFLYDFFETIIEKDLRYIEEMSDRLIKKETAVISGTMDGFNSYMLTLKKEILSFYRYYTQLVDVGSELEENENRFFSDSDVEKFARFTTRAERLREEMQFLRETSNQLRDVYSSQIDRKMNKSMNALTVVTMLLLPISTISAWYGMNFVYMPELAMKYGYLGCIIATILSILGCWTFIKKKKII